MDSTSTVSLVVPSGPQEDDNRGGKTSKRMKKELTEDLIVDILVRLPVKSLMRFKSVSKRWYSLIISPSFIAMHSAHIHRNNKIVSLWKFYQVTTVCSSGMRARGIFLFGGEDSIKELTFYSSSDVIGIDIVGCFNGVVCLSILPPEKRMYALWNPATRQVKEIGGSLMDSPDESNRRIRYGSGFCFDPVTNAFKVVQIKLTDSGGGGEARAQVSLFSTSNNSWTVKNMDVPYQIEWTRTVRVREIACVNGYMHWLEGMYILSYNMIDEVFQRIEMPSRPVFLRYYILTIYRGSLAVFVHRSYTEIDVWVLNDCGGTNQSWSIVLTCKPPRKFSNASGVFNKDGVDLIILNDDWDNNFLYDPENAEIKMHGGLGLQKTTFPYSESLVLL